MSVSVFHCCICTFFDVVAVSIRLCVILSVSISAVPCCCFKAVSHVGIQLKQGLDGRNDAGSISSFRLW